MITKYSSIGIAKPVKSINNSIQWLKCFQSNKEIRQKTTKYANTTKICQDSI